MQIHRGIFPMGLCIASFSFGMTTCTSSGTGLRVQKFLRRIFLHAKGSALACNYNVPRRADRQATLTLIRRVNLDCERANAKCYLPVAALQLVSHVPLS